jgi:hypothetical protein
VIDVRRIWAKLDQSTLFPARRASYSLDKSQSTHGSIDFRSSPLFEDFEFKFTLQKQGKRRAVQMLILSHNFSLFYQQTEVES